MTTMIINLEAPAQELTPYERAQQLMAKGDEALRYYVKDMEAVRQHLQARDPEKAAHAMTFANQNHAEAKAAYRAARAIAETL